MNSLTYNMDCMEGMAKFPDKYFELAIVDVPYGIKESLKDNQSRGRARGGLNNSAMGWAKDYGKKEWDKKPPDKIYFSELLRVSKNQIIWGANHFVSKIPYDSPCWIVWDKDNGENDFADCELAWSSFETAVRKVRIRWHGLFQEDMKNKEVRIHPTQKPVKLYKWLLDKYAKPNDKILDTHLGSGSSRIACYDYGFDFTGFELDKDYFEAQEKRFNNHISQIRMFAQTAI